MNKQVASAVRALREGGVVLLPTDTVYGLAVMPTVPSAIERLFAMKGRPSSRNLPIMVGSPEDLPVLGLKVTAEAKTLLSSKFVPGPLTIAFGFLESTMRPEWLVGREEVAIRIPRENILLQILQEIGPLLVTSANAHGKSTPETVPEILEQLVTAPNYVLDDGERKTVPSTLVNCNLPTPAVEREGVVTFEEIATLIRCTR